MSLPPGFVLDPLPQAQQQDQTQAPSQPSGNGLPPGFVLDPIPGKAPQVGSLTPAQRAYFLQKTNAPHADISDAALVALAKKMGVMPPPMPTQKPGMVPFKGVVDGVKGVANALPQAAQAAGGQLGDTLKTTANAVQGNPEAVSDVTTSANTAVKPFYKPIPVVEQQKQKMMNAIPGQGLPSKVARTALDVVVPTSAADIGLTAAGSGALDEGVQLAERGIAKLGDVIDTKIAKAADLPTQKSIKSIQQAGDNMGEMLRPSKGQVDEITLRKGKKLDYYNQLAAREGLPIKENTGNNTYDAAEAIEQVKEKRAGVHGQINDILENNKDDFDLEDLRRKALSDSSLKKRFSNSSERIKAKADINQYIDDEIKEYGKTKLSAVEFNNVKQGMWSVGYDQMRPNTKDTARIIGHIAKEQLENKIADPTLRALNEKSGDYATLENILEKTNGRKITGGKLGNMAARAAGMAIGHAVPLPIPVAKEVAGGYIGGKVSRYLNNPERLSQIAATKMSKAEKYLNSIGMSIDDLKVGQKIPTPAGEHEVIGFDNDGHPLVEPTDKIDHSGNYTDRSNQPPNPKAPVGGVPQGTRRPNVDPYDKEAFVKNNVFKISEINENTPLMKVGQIYKTERGRIQITSTDGGIKYKVLYN